MLGWLPSATADGQVSLLLHGLLEFCRHRCGAGAEPRAVAFSADLARLLVLCGEQTDAAETQTAHTAAAGPDSQLTTRGG